MDQQNLKIASDPNYNEYSYDNDQFQSPSDNSYASKVDTLFSINYESLNYQNIQFSTNQMRLMMKDLSKKLDQKIHKYYGLLGQKHSKSDDDLQTYKQKLNKELQSHKKLIQTQITEIKEIQQLDLQMGSTKRVEKQAQRLRQYFETKKAMIEADKQTRFSKGQMNKAADYLARDLDSQKYYFRLNKIKEEFQYAMLKQRNLITKIDQLDSRYNQLQQKHEQINQIYNQKLIQAQNHQILIEENKLFFTQYQTKKQYLLIKEEIKKKTEILKYNIQNTVIKITSDIQKMKQIQTQNMEKITFYEQEISNLSKQISQSTENTKISTKIELNPSIRSINILLKTKKDKNDEMQKNSSQVFEKSQSKFKPTVQMSESSILLKPNFKIKYYLTRQRSKMEPMLSSRVNKSMDLDIKQQKGKDLRGLLENIGQRGHLNENRILKWEPRKKSSIGKKLFGQSDKYAKGNPEEQIKGA